MVHDGNDSVVSSNLLYLSTGVIFSFQATRTAGRCRSSACFSRELLGVSYVSVSYK